MLHNTEATKIPHKRYIGKNTAQVCGSLILNIDEDQES